MSDCLLSWVKVVHGLCRQLQDSLQHLPCGAQEVQEDVLAAHEVLHNARESLKVETAVL